MVARSVCEKCQADFAHDVLLPFSKLTNYLKSAPFCRRWSYSRLSRMPQHIINDAHKAAAAEHSVTVVPAGAAFERFESAANPLGICLRAADGEHPRYSSSPLSSHRVWLWLLTAASQCRWNVSDKLLCLRSAYLTKCFGKCL